MLRRGVSRGVRAFLPSRRASGLFPLVLLTILSGTLGWAVWRPYGALLGVLPPVFVFGFVYWESTLDGESPPELPPARGDPPLSLDDRVDLVSALHDAGVLTTGGEGEAVLTESFGRDWRARMEEMEGRSYDREALSRLIGVDEARLELEWDGDWESTELVARLDGGAVGRWSSRAAFVADLTAVAAFRRHYPQWWRLSTGDRNRVLGALRLSLRECPTCDGRIRVETGASAMDETGRHVTATCRACDSTLFDAVVAGGEPVTTDTEAGAGPTPESGR